MRWLMMHGSIIRRDLLGVMMALPVIFMACASAPSHFRRNYDVSDTFENYQLLNGYQYYLNGLPHSPTALVSIKKNYRLSSPVWHAVKMDRAKLRDLVSRMLNTPGSEYNTAPNGAYILNDRGQVIGIWYSVWALPVMTFQSDTEFTISQPMMTFPLSNRDPEKRGILP
jgi:hypothetical protein